MSLNTQLGHKRPMQTLGSCTDERGLILCLSKPDGLAPADRLYVRRRKSTDIVETQTVHDGNVEGAAALILERWPR